jgi:phosphoribosylcarboxyaminoimidazole (NCAIR) mutase
MPKGCPVATMAIGIPGAINSSIFAISILALNNENISKKLKIWHKKKVSKVPMVPKDE